MYLFQQSREFIRKYNGTKQLALIHFNEKYEIIFDRSRYLVILKSNILDFYSHKYTKIKQNSDHDLPQEKTLKIQNLIIFIKSVFKDNRDHYYYETFSEKSSYKQVISTK